MKTKNVKLEQLDYLKKKYNLITIAFELIEKINQIGLNFNFHNPETYIVGGAVRDIILSNNINDIDISTNIPVDILEKEFNTHDIGKNKDFSIIVVEYKNHNIEIANFRKDGIYENGRHPINVDLNATFKDDTNRRDFSINSLGLTNTGYVVDHHNGMTDLKYSIIRTVGDPNARFSEDFLRMLRAIRFASRLEFEIEENTMQAIKKHAHNITSVSAERITQELNKMASETGEKFANSLILMKESGLLKEILPEIDVMDQHEHSPDHHPEGCVWSHTLSALKQHKGSDRLVNLSILFHDVGKPPTHFVDENGMHRFFTHENRGFHMIDDIAKRMKFDNDTKEAIKFATLNHMKFHLVNKMSTKKVVALMTDPNFNVLHKVSECDDKSRLHAFDPESWQRKVDKIEQIRKTYFESDGESDMDMLTKIKKTINGKLVMDLLNITTGPNIGKVIKNTIDWIVDNNIDINDIDKIKEFILSQK